MKESKTKMAGVSIAWVIVYGALCGATSLIPLFPYVGGGGYLPLCVAFSAMAPLIMGAAGIAAAFIGGVIGMFVSPAAYPLGFLDVILTGTLPALLVTLTINNNKFWKITVPVFVAITLMAIVFPYYWPGPTAGFENPPQPTYILLSAIYWLPSIAICATPIGIKYGPNWSRTNDRKKEYTGIILAVLSGMMMWFIPWTLPYWYLFHYPVALSMAVFVSYSWWVPALSAVITAIIIPIVEGLKKSGFPKAPLAIW